MREPDGEFEERILHSRAFARRGWKLAGLLYVGPVLAIPVLLLLAGNVKGAGGAAVAALAFVGLPLAFAAFSRRPPT